MGTRGLYPTISKNESSQEVRLMMNFISFCDGDHTLLEIAENLNTPIYELYNLVDNLQSHGLIEVID